jgi:UDP-N-acetylglucosamine 2-epimerase (non-hydrolysing)
MPYSTISREYLLREGLPPDRVIKTGSPMYEVLHHYLPRIEQSEILTKLKLQPGDYFVVSCHREENVDSEQNLSDYIELMHGLVQDFGKRVIVTTHPRTRKKLEECGFQFNQKIELHKPFSLTDYVKLQINSCAVLSDSGTINEESSILNFPALNIREAHERPEGMEEAAVMMTGLDWNIIRQALDVLALQGRGAERTLRTVEDYQMPNVSEKVVRIIMSYTGYVNRTVWHRQ